MKIFMVILGTAVITWIAFSLIHGVRAGLEGLWMVSAVKAPGGMAIREIQSDMNAGRYGLAKAKLDALAEEWQRFNAGPDSCSGHGIGDIMVIFSRLDTNSSATNPEPNGAANGSQPIRSETNSTSPATGSSR